MTATLLVRRVQVLAHRRRVGALDERLTNAPASLRAAGWIGLQDSMPRAALLSVHARVEGATSQSWEDPAFVQLWGPRFQAYVAPAEDHVEASTMPLPNLTRDITLRWNEPAGRRLHSGTAR